MDCVTDIMSTYNNIQSFAPGTIFKRESQLLQKTIYKNYKRKVLQCIINKNLNKAEVYKQSLDKPFKDRRNRRRGRIIYRRSHKIAQPYQQTGCKKEGSCRQTWSKAKTTLEQQCGYQHFPERQCILRILHLLLADSAKKNLMSRKLIFANALVKMRLTCLQLQALYSLHSVFSVNIVDGDILFAVTTEVIQSSQNASYRVQSDISRAAYTSTFPSLEYQD